MIHMVINTNTYTSKGYRIRKTSLTFLDFRSNFGAVACIMAISGLAGKTSWELALIDQFCDLTEDMYREVLKEFYEKNEAKKVGSVV